MSTAQRVVVLGMFTFLLGFLMTVSAGIQRSTASFGSTDGASRYDKGTISGVGCLILIFGLLALIVAWSALAP